ncbi:hypothetical protein ACFYO7_02725 [Nocardia salmonicida]|uniref:hypothetical protein n=1 Tax=Nocardia salmonicida TaxID=53431 RepID=UPI0036878A25
MSAGSPRRSTGPPAAIGGTTHLRGRVFVETCVYDIEAALTAYEAARFPRSAKAAADAHRILDLRVGDSAPFGLVDFMTGVS